MESPATTSPQPLSKAERQAWQQSIENADSRILLRYAATVDYLERLLEQPAAFVAVRDGNPVAVLSESRFVQDEFADCKLIAVPMVRPALT